MPESKLMYDPPGGWKYGFPKPYEPLTGETMEATLQRDGYKGDLARAVKYCRFWPADLESPAKNKTMTDVEISKEALRWKAEVIDKLIINWAYRREHENNPRLAVADLIQQEVRQALDPLISEEAQKLIGKNYVLKSDYDEALENDSRIMGEMQDDLYAAEQARDYWKHLYKDLASER